MAVLGTTTITIAVLLIVIGILLLLGTTITAFGWLGRFFGSARACPYTTKNCWSEFEYPLRLLKVYLFKCPRLEPTCEGKFIEQIRGASSPLW